MRRILGIAAIVVLFVAVGWLGIKLRHDDSTQTAASADTPIAKILNPVEGPATLEGTAIMDTSSGLPAVPYIEYNDENGATTTKQLIFADERGCLPGAGDLPCVPSYPILSAYPQLVTGQHIHVSGYIRADRFLITDISVES